MKFSNLLLISTLYVISSLSNHKPIGIANVGNTCFMNAVLQCLYHSEDITNFLLNIESSNYYKPNTVATEYIKFLKSYKAGLKEDKDIHPIEWCQRIWTLEEASIKRFPEMMPADAFEFLSITLGHLGLDSTLSDVDPSKIVKRLPYPLEKLADDPMVRSVGSILKKYSRDNLRSISTVADFPIISLDVIDDKGLPLKNLKRCLDYYFNEENLKIFDLPKYLIIHLKRFMGTLEETEKIKHAIPFPLTLAMDNYLDQNTPYGPSPLYDLSGIVLHEGAHYTSYVKVGNTWWFCNDAMEINPIDEQVVEFLANEINDLQEPTPYILFYRQISSEEPTIYFKNDVDINDIKEKVLALLPDLIDQFINQIGEALISEPKYFSKYEKAIEIMNAIKLDKEVLMDSLNEYLESNRVDINSVKESFERGLIDETFFANEIAVYIQNMAKKNLYPGQEFRAKIIAEGI